MLPMSDFCALATDGGEETGIEDGDKMLTSFSSTEVGKTGGRAIFYLGSANVTSLDFYFLNHRHVRIYQRCSSLRCQLGSHGHGIEGVNQLLRRECEDVEEGRERGLGAPLQLRSEGASVAVGGDGEEPPGREKKDESSGRKFAEGGYQEK